MNQKRRWSGREGFTLIEILVSLILLALLVAAVFPVVTQQVSQGDPVRTANDLSSIKTAVNSFRLDVRPQFPGDLEDLVFSPSAGDDLNIEGDPFNDGVAARWNGPYLDAALVELDGLVPGDAMSTGFGRQIQNELACFDGGTNADDANTCDKGTHSVAVKIAAVEEDEFNLIDELIDGTADSTTGNFRLLGTEVAYYLLSPFF